jgi:hypothetical protein
MSSSRRRRSSRSSRKGLSSQRSTSQELQKRPSRRGWWRSLLRQMNLLNSFKILAAVLRPKEPGKRSRRELVALRLRLVSYTLFLIMATSVVMNSLPLQLGSADWYLRTMASLAGSSSLLIGALGLGEVALYLAPNGRESERLAGLLKGVSRLGLWLVVALLPLQLMTAGWLVKQIESSDLAKVGRVRTEGAALIEEARAAANKEAFAQLLQRRSIGVDRARLEANPLEAAQSELEQSLEATASQLEKDLTTRRRQGFFRTALELLKLASTYLILAVFLWLYVVWSVESRQRELGLSGEAAEDSELMADEAELEPENAI